MTFKQVYYLTIILVIYFCIATFFINTFYPPNAELLFFSSIIDIFLSVYITINFYDGSTKRKIISIFLMPLVSISYLLFGGSVIGYWDFIRIPALLCLVVHYYNKFLVHTKENNLNKLILVLVTIVFFTSILTLILEDKNPINAFAMVTNAFTSNSYIASGKTTAAVLVSTFVAWSGYIISGVATASLAAAIIRRHFDKKFEKITSENGPNEIRELKNELKSIHDENAELKREIVELKDLIKNK